MFRRSQTVLERAHGPHTRSGWRTSTWVRLCLVAMIAGACMDTSLGVDGDAPEESTTSSALHAQSGPVWASGQESDTRYYIRAEAGRPLSPWEPVQYSWYLMYQNYSALYIADTEPDDPHIGVDYAKSGLPAGEYWIEVDTLAVDNTSPGCQPYGCYRYFTYESEGFTLPLLASTPDVGVIPNGSSCPTSAPAVHIFMDNEDNRAASGVSGWVGGTVVDGNRNTNFLFCRVSGYNFKSLASYSSNSTNYAVLRLGASCPPGSIPFARYFDNEDYQNTNNWSGNIAPNTNITGDTTLNFCLFKGDGVVANKLPSLGFSYGVFAPSNFLPAAKRGYIFTDDEDNNANGYTVDPAWATTAQAIVTAGGNTTLYTAKAVECNDGLCSYGETPSSCYADCDTCNNGICRANENVYNCWQDCGYCNDGVCSPNETASSCPEDCGSGCTALGKDGNRIPCP